MSKIKQLTEMERKLAREMQEDRKMGLKKAVRENGSFRKKVVDKILKETKSKK